MLAQLHDAARDALHAHANAAEDEPAQPYYPDLLAFVREYLSAT